MIKKFLYFSSRAYWIGRMLLCNTAAVLSIKRSYTPNRSRPSPYKAASDQVLSFQAIYLGMDTHTCQSHLSSQLLPPGINTSRIHRQTALPCKASNVSHCLLITENGTQTSTISISVQLWSGAANSPTYPVANHHKTPLKCCSVHRHEVCCVNSKTSAMDSVTRSPRSSFKHQKALLKIIAASPNSQLLNLYLVKATRL